MVDLDDSVEQLKIDRRGALPTRHAAPRQRWAPLAIIAIVATLAYLYLSGPLRPTPAVAVTTAQRFYPAQQLTVLNATGYVVPWRRAEVASKATGRLQWLGVQEGSRVHSGAVIARLENGDVLAQQAQAEAGIAAARAQVGAAQAELVEAAAALRRAVQLTKRQFFAQQELDAVRARRARAVAQLDNAKANVKVARAAYRNASVAVEYTLIRAPFDGIVVSKNANVGDVVAPFSSAISSKAAVVSIVDMDTLEVEADVSESSLSKITVGQPCEIQLDALPDTRLRGAVGRIVPTVDRAKATVIAKLEFIDKDPRVLPEMSAKVAFLQRELSPTERQPVTAVPATAVVRRDGDTIVWRVVDERLQAVAVHTGRSFDHLVELTAGIAAGDTIVTAPVADYRDGWKIRPTAAE